jgi:hypothetical protein
LHARNFKRNIQSGEWFTYFLIFQVIVVCHTVCTFAL